MVRNRNRRKLEELDSFYTSTQKIFKSFEEDVDKQKNTHTTKLSQLDVLSLQRNFKSVRERFHDKQEFYNALFLFLIKLTNARGAAFFICEDSETIEIPYKIILTSNKDKSDTILETIKTTGIKSLLSKQVCIEKVDNWVILSVPIIRDVASDNNSGIACVLEIFDSDQLTPYILILQFIAGYIPLIESDHQGEIFKTQAMRSSSFVDLFKEIATYKSFDKSVDHLLNVMKNHLNCQRIAISFTKGKRTKLFAITNIDKFDRRARLVCLLENAMNESLQQEKTIEFPMLDQENREIQLDLAHQLLKEETKSETIITTAIKNKEQPFGVWSFFWEKEDAITKEDVYFIEVVSEYITPLLELVRKKSFFIRNRTTSSIYNKIIFSILCISAFYYVLMIPYPHYVTANCYLEPVTTRTISAPFDSIIQKVHHKVGDFVEKGENLIHLDGRELRLQYFAAKEELASAKKITLQLLAEKKIAEYQAEMLNVKKIRKEMELLEHRLISVKIISPQAGIITEGDLEKILGTTIRRGDSLLEIAPLGELLIKVQVDELDMSFIKKDMVFEIQLYAFFDKKWTSKITDVSPKSEIIEQKNIFICKAKLENKDGKLLPGMSGEARIFISDKRIWWVWLYKPMAWIKAKLWW